MQPVWWLPPPALALPHLSHAEPRGRARSSTHLPTTRPGTAGFRPAGTLSCTLQLHRVVADQHIAFIAFSLCGTGLHVSRCMPTATACRCSNASANAKIGKKQILREEKMHELRASAALTLLCRWLVMDAPNADTLVSFCVGNRRLRLGKVKSEP